MKFLPLRLIALLLFLFTLLISPAVAVAEEAHSQETHSVAHAPEKLGDLMHVAAITPFALLLMCIALFPLLNPHWWEHNQNKGMIVALLGLPVIGYLFTFGHHGLEAMEHSGKEYLSFLILLGSLFIISGGIYVRGALHGSPLLNTMSSDWGPALAVSLAPPARQCC